MGKLKVYISTDYTLIYQLITVNKFYISLFGIYTLLIAATISSFSPIPSFLRIFVFR